MGTVPLETRLTATGHRALRSWSGSTSTCGLTAASAAMYVTCTVPCNSLTAVSAAMYVTCTVPCNRLTAVRAAMYVRCTTHMVSSCIMNIITQNVIIQMNCYTYSSLKGPYFIGRVRGYETRASPSHRGRWGTLMLRRWVLHPRTQLMLNDGYCTPELG